MARNNKNPTARLLNHSKPTRAKIPKSMIPTWGADLTPREYILVSEYLRTLSVTSAGIAAGFKVTSAGSTASQHLGSDKLRTAIEKALAQHFNITRARIVQEMATIAFANPLDYVSWDENGIELKPSKNLKRTQGMAIAEVLDKSTIERSRVVDELAADGGSQKVQTQTLKRDVRLKFLNKIDALEKLAKLVGFRMEREIDDVPTDNVTLVIEGLFDDDEKGKALSTVVTAAPENSSTDVEDAVLVIEDLDEEEEAA